MRNVVLPANSTLFSSVQPLARSSSFNVIGSEPRAQKDIAVITSQGKEKRKRRNRFVFASAYFFRVFWN